MFIRIFVSITFIGMITVNALANILPINGLNTGEVSQLYPSLFTPAGITFSIWSVLYLLMTAFVIFSWTTRDSRMEKILPAFILSCMLNSTWILVWHFLFPGISVVVMIALLGTLIFIFTRIQSEKFTSTREYIVVVLPFTLYLAWICVATIANISAWLVSLSWEGGFLSPQFWTIIMMTIAAALALVIASRFQALPFILVVVWALLGIYLRWRTSEYVNLVYASLLLIGVLSSFFLYTLLKRTRAR